MECNFMKANEIDLFLLPQPLTVNSTPAPISHIYYTHTYTHLLSCSWSRQKYKLLSSKLLRRWEIRISPDADQRDHISKVEGDT